ncbi:MAG: type I-F CRISPR-associated protein Csy2 [SAR324 cluster bacterium]|nr:type I-F CRISPR-associated protein Csy2 [SAR324 cluster bacterium]MBL7035517.1 type I-F CRISPR-associated protein Csy2 [SAR324 cluster bacterium]
MTQFILIKRIKVQNANAIAGFTWGFPAITHFLGFTHNLSRKLSESEKFSDINFTGCGVIAHKHHVHNYQNYGVEFTQSRNPPYLSSHSKVETPPIIEEGKMNMTVSLLLGYEGNLGNRIGLFYQWLENSCYLQRLAGGTILNIATIEAYTLSEDREVRSITRELLPGFILLDRSAALADHYQSLQQKNLDVELLDTWLDFSAIKQQARPKSNLISKHLTQLATEQAQLLELWVQHLTTPYQHGKIHYDLQTYFSELADQKQTSLKALLQQWENYCNPTENTEADWEYLKKPAKGYLVPIMIGYKAISKVYENSEVANTRDNETDVCFVESVHSIGEWSSVHRIKNVEGLSSCLWNYHYEDEWYLCKQDMSKSTNDPEEREIIIEKPDDDFS